MQRHLVAAGAGSAVPSAPSKLNGQASTFLFSPENFRNPKFPSGLSVRDVPLRLATNESLKGFGRIVNSVDEFTTWVVGGWGGRGQDRRGEDMRVEESRVDWLQHWQVDPPLTFRFPPLPSLPFSLSPSLPPSSSPS